jgi:hypothetical protein
MPTVDSRTATLGNSPRANARRRTKRMALTVPVEVSGKDVENSPIVKYSKRFPRCATPCRSNTDFITRAARRFPVSCESLHHGRAG